MEFSPTELLTLLILLAGSPLLLGAVQDSPLPGKRWFVMAYAALLLSNVCTIVEAWVAYAFFNDLEHIATAACAMLFFVAVRVFLRGSASVDQAGQ
jgi:hypothetical protein